MKRAGIIIVACVFGISCANKTDVVSGATAWEGGQALDPVAVEALSVSRGALIDTVSASGTVQGANEALVIATAQGYIEKVSFVPGDRVKEGQELLKIDDGLAAIKLEQAKDQLDSATLTLRANEGLVDSGGVSASALSQARSAASSARAAYESALKAFNDATIRAPLSGIVASREEGITVGNAISPPNRIARIVDDSSFRITVGLGEREIGLVEVGAAVRVFVPSALGNEAVTGTVRSIGGGADPATGSFPLVIEFPNKWKDRVRSGMSASVEIAARSQSPAVVIPVAALVRRDKRYAVFVEDDGFARVRPVSTGRRYGVRTEILTGLEEGETILVSGFPRLRDGTPVAVTTRGSSADRE